MSEPYEIGRLSGEAWNELCDRDPVLAGQIEAGLVDASDLQLVAELVLQGVRIGEPGDASRFRIA